MEQASSDLDTPISAAVELLRRSPNLTDEAAFAELLAQGIDRQLAAHLIEFLAMAYVRNAGPRGRGFRTPFRERSQTARSVITHSYPNLFGTRLWHMRKLK